MKKIYRGVYRYFDKLEDRVRNRLSRYPLIYSLIAGTAIVLFWRGVWDTADELAVFIPEKIAWIDGPLSIAISVFILLITGLFVSFFVSDQIILSGVKQEKKMIEKTEDDIKAESEIIAHVEQKINHMSEELESIYQKLGK